MIEANAVLLECSEELWLTLIDECVAHVDKTITFNFKNGYSITKWHQESVIMADFFVAIAYTNQWFYSKIIDNYLIK